MSHLMKGKVYGLTIPGKAPKANPSTSNPLARKKPSIFNQSDSESDKSDSEDWVKKSMKKTSSANAIGIKKQAKIAMAKALEEDPTVFQYDEVYDKIEEGKAVVEEQKKEVDRKPKYISNLLKSAEIRKKDYEKLIERKVQKEREAEGDEFADKEKFVTSAYRKKMEEMAAEEEEEERKARMEAALDVTKQNDLSGFYRHIYRQTWGEEKGQVEEKVKTEPPEEEKEVEAREEIARKVKEDLKKIKVESDEEEEDQDSQGPDSGEKSKVGAVGQQGTLIKKVGKGKAALRQKQNMEDNDASSSSSEEDDDSSSSGESGEEEEKKGPVTKEKVEVELTAEEKMEKRRQEMKEAKEKRERRKRRIERDEESSGSSGEEEEEKGDASGKKKAKTADGKEKTGDSTAGATEAKETLPAKQKIDLWKKRTVGEVFDAALERYWQRVAERKARNG